MSRFKKRLLALSLAIPFVVIASILAFYFWYPGDHGKKQQTEDPNLKPRDDLTEGENWQNLMSAGPDFKTKPAFQGKTSVVFANRFQIMEEHAKAYLELNNVREDAKKFNDLVSKNSMLDLTQAKNLKSARSKVLDDYEKSKEKESITYGKIIFEPAEPQKQEWHNKLKEWWGHREDKFTIVDLEEIAKRSSQLLTQKIGEGGISLGEEIKLIIDFINEFPTHSGHWEVYRKLLLTINPPDGNKPGNEAGIKNLFTKLEEIFQNLKIFKNDELQRAAQIRIHQFCAELLPEKLALDKIVLVIPDQSLGKREPEKHERTEFEIHIESRSEGLSFDPEGWHEKRISSDNLRSLHYAKKTTGAIECEPTPKSNAALHYHSARQLLPLPNDKASLKRWNKVTMADVWKVLAINTEEEKKDLNDLFQFEKDVLEKQGAVLAHDRLKALDDAINKYPHLFPE
jgi:hypothetical protein